MGHLKYHRVFIKFRDDAKLFYTKLVQDLRDLGFELEVILPKSNTIIGYATYDRIESYLDLPYIDTLITDKKYRLEYPIRVKLCYDRYHDKVFSGASFKDSNNRRWYVWICQKCKLLGYSRKLEHPPEKEEFASIFEYHMLKVPNMIRPQKANKKQKDS